MHVELRVCRLLSGIQQEYRYQKNIVIEYCYQGSSKNIVCGTY